MGAGRSGLDSNKWGRWRSAVVVRGANGGPRRRRWARPAGQLAVGDHPGPGWREFAGTFGCPVDGSAAGGTVRLGMEWLAAGVSPIMSAPAVHGDRSWSSGAGRLLTKKFRMMESFSQLGFP